MFGQCVRRKALLAAIIFVILAAPTIGLADEFSNDQQAALQKGRIVFIGEPVANNPWPKARVFRLVNASPLEVIAVFFDYATASKYIPNLKQSKVCSVIAPWKKEVLYEVKLPLLPNEVYVAQNTVQKQSASDCYEIAWLVKKAKYIKSSIGSFQVKPYNGNQALICYTNLVDPGTQIATCLRNVAQKQAKDTVDAIANYVVNQKQTNCSALQRQITSFTDALRSLEAYAQPSVE